MIRDDNVLLTDEQMAEFIVRGYLVLKNDIPDDVHRRVYESMKQICTEEGNPGNNLLPRVPEVADLFSTPVARGALASVLGPDYIRHPHLYGHRNVPNFRLQKWHKDYYTGWAGNVTHRPWWAMLLYYTHDVDPSMGPTDLKPGSQYYETDPGESYENLFLTGKAGTMALVHYDIWHRAFFNSSDKDRYMIKLFFMRQSEPAFPSWDNRSAELPLSATTPIHDHRELWEDVWHWLRGSRQVAGWDRPADPADLAAASDRKLLLASDSEPDALNAAYTLGRMGFTGMETLLDALTAGSDVAAHRAVYGLQTFGSLVVPPLLERWDRLSGKHKQEAVYLLGLIGSSAYLAVPRLLQCLQDADETVVWYAAEALGFIQQPAEPIADALIRLMDADPPDLAAAAASLALLRLARHVKTGKLVESFQRMLRHTSRYVRGYAAEGLTRMGTEEAVRAVIQDYRTARWCSISTVSNPY